MKTYCLYLTAPTADAGTINQLVTQKLREAVRPSEIYHRAGVWLQDFIPEQAFQPDLLGNVSADVQESSSNRMQAMDSLNERYGKHTVYLAAEGLADSWQPKRSIQMPRFTTRWDEIPTAKLL